MYVFVCVCVCVFVCVCVCVWVCGWVGVGACIQSFIKSSHLVVECSFNVQHVFPEQFPTSVA